MGKTCFMIMPYGEKPTLLNEPGVPDRIDFDALWEKALRPAIESFGYTAVRADQDLGALIILEMIERLALSDFVLADVTIPNGNVYYEVGLRHAVRRTGCAMIGADWSRPLFDINQMRRLTYPMPESSVSDATAAAIGDKLKGAVALLEGESPFYEVFPKYPDLEIDRRGPQYQETIRRLSDFQAKVRAVRAAPAGGRKAEALKLLEATKDEARQTPALAMDLLSLLRDEAAWPEMSGFIASLPEQVRSLASVQELGCLAQSKRGDHQEAIGALEQLIQLSGETSERRGLLGGRFKALFRAATVPVDRARYLAKSIEEYERGMALDLNDYFPSCNLPRLYRLRNWPGDDEKARSAATVALMACERSMARNPSDPWGPPTMLAMAFDSGDAAAALRFYQQMLTGGVAAFKLESTIPDLETTLGLLKDPSQVAALTPILEALKQLLPPPASPAPGPTA